MKIIVDEKELKRINSKLKSINHFMADSVEEIAWEQANIVVDEMKQEVPVDTGRLQRNIHTRGEKSGLVIESEAISPQSREDYAPLIEEFGGRFRKGQYFFSKAATRFRDRLVKELKNGLNSVMNRKTGSTQQTKRSRRWSPGRR